MVDKFPPVKGLNFPPLNRRLEEEKVKGSERLHAAHVVRTVLTDYVTIIPEWGCFISSGSLIVRVQNV